MSFNIRCPLLTCLFDNQNNVFSQYKINTQHNSPICLNLILVDMLKKLTWPELSLTGSHIAMLQFHRKSGTLRGMYKRKVKRDTCQGSVDSIMSPTRWHCCCTRWLALGTLPTPGGRHCAKYIILKRVYFI